MGGVGALWCGGLGGTVVRGGRGHCGVGAGGTVVWCGVGGGHCGGGGGQCLSRTHMYMRPQRQLCITNTCETTHFLGKVSHLL